MQKQLVEAETNVENIYPSPDAILRAEILRGAVGAYAKLKAQCDNLAFGKLSMFEQAALAKEVAQQTSATLESVVHLLIEFTKELQRLRPFSDEVEWDVTEAEADLFHAINQSFSKSRAKSESDKKNDWFQK